MKNFLLPILFVFAFLVCGCASEEGEQTVTIDNRYSLTIPKFLSEGTDLHDDASLQYQHIFKEFYVVVIDEPKDEMHSVLELNDLTDIYSKDIDGYAKLIFDSVYESLLDPVQTDVVETTVNGMAARLSTLVGMADDISIFYDYGVYESEDRYYQVIAWTLSDQQSKYQSQMDAILHSLKELNSNRRKSKSPANNNSH
ncbi:MAG: hypothetical protein ACSHXF_11420 [Aquaticitalea sp.]